jgi:benzoate-CoA ligase
VVETFNAAEWLVDRHVSSGGGERIAFYCQDRSMTYQGLQDAVRAAGNGLARIGVRPGERVVLLVADEEAFPATFLGALRAGMIAVPVSTMLRPSEVAALVVDSGASALVLSERYAGHLPEVEMMAPALRAAVVAGSPDAIPTGVRTPVHAWSSFEDASPVGAEPTTAQTAAFWLYTSGTTGRPKGAIHRHGDVRVVCDTYARTVLGMTRDDVCYSVAKLFFAFGLGNALFFPLAAGGAAVLDPDPPTPARVAELMGRHQPSLFFAPPGFCAAMADTNLDRDGLKSVRYTVTAGEALPGEVMRRFVDQFGTEMLDGIGSTEALHIFCSNHAGDVRAGTSGRPVEGYTLELRDDTGAVITAPETPGYLWVRGDSIAAGYWERPEETAATFVDGWLRTGDVYCRSADGYWRFVGRNSDMIKAGGIWVSPAEVESVLLEHEDVLEAAVVGGRDADGLEMVVAFVVPRSGTTIDVAGVAVHCRRRMAAFKRPRQIRVLDALPKTATGKIQRFALRERVATPGGA